MIGGDKDVVQRLDPIFKTLAPVWARRSDAGPGEGQRRHRPSRVISHCGPVGAGHFVKMVHQRHRVRP